MNGNKSRLILHKSKYILCISKFVNLEKYMYRCVGIRAPSIEYESCPTVSASIPLSKMTGFFFSLHVVTYLTEPKKKNNSNNFIFIIQNDCLVSCRMSTSSATRPLWSTWVASTTMQHKWRHNGKEGAKDKEERSTLKRTTTTKKLRGGKKKLQQICV